MTYVNRYPRRLCRLGNGAVVCGFGSENFGYEFYIYDPWYEYDDPLMIRSYSWLRNGYDNSGEYDNDGLIWNWIVTFRIGEYTRTSPSP